MINLPLPKMYIKKKKLFLYLNVIENKICSSHKLASHNSIFRIVTWAAARSVNENSHFPMMLAQDGKNANRMCSREERRVIVLLPPNLKMEVN